MLSYVADGANLITLAGVASSILAITLALRGELSGAAIALVGAFVCDVLDGPVAKRTPGRTADQGAFGASLDSLADMLAAGAAIGVIVLRYGHFGFAYAVVAVALAVATALRLSFFAVHGLAGSGGASAYTGLPTDQAVLAVVAVLLLDGPVGPRAFPVVLAAAAVVLAALMVCRVRVPKLTGVWSAASIVFALMLAAGHLARLLG